MNPAEAIDLPATWYPWCQRCRRDGWSIPSVVRSDEGLHLCATCAEDYLDDPFEVEAQRVARALLDRHPELARDLLQSIEAWLATVKYPRVDEPERYARLRMLRSVLTDGLLAVAS